MDFKGIVGHEDIIRHFKSSIELDKVSHAYIINGEVDRVGLILVMNANHACRQKQVITRI